MKAYTVPLSLAGAALVVAGGLAYLLNEEGAVLPLANLGAGVALLLVAGLLEPELFRQYGRWLNAFWGSLMVLGIIAMLNFLGGHYHHRLDLTAGQLHSLSDLTVNTLKGLEREVRALAFMEKGRDEVLEGLLKEYATHSGQFTYEFIDPEREPEQAKRYGVRNDNTLVIEAGQRQQKVTELNEKEITSALLKVVRDRQDKLYLSVGHGEGGTGAGEQGYSRLKGRLQEFNYQVGDSLFLAREGAVPPDCALLVILSPKTPFFSNEVEAIRRYLQGGGAALVLLDPPFQTGLEGLLGEWGVEVGEDFAIDTSGIGSLFGLDYTSPAAVDYGDHPITRKHRGLMTFYELARSVRFAERAGLSGVELVKTSEQGWAETDLGVLQAGGNRTVKLDQGVDRPGPVPLAVAVQAEKGRLVVFGDADFASNRYFDLQGNGDLALNAVSWLAEDESLISIRPREPGYNPIALTERQSDWVFWLTVVLYPLGVAVLGIAVVSRKGRWSLADLAAAGLGIALSLGVVGLLNFIGDRYHSRFDLTAEKLFTLSPDTRRLLEAVGDQDRYVSVKTFMAPTEEMRFQEIMDEYQYASKRFDYEVLDPQKHTLEVKQYGIRERGTSVVEVSGEGKVRTEKITEQTEEALSNAIQRALKAEERKVYFSGGHQEGQIAQVDGKGFSMLSGRLKEMNFQVEDGLALEGRGVPEDATLVAVVGPQRPFSPAAVAGLREFLKKGKSALLLLDPGPPTGLEGLLGEYGIQLGQDFVVDLSGIGQLLGADVSVPVVVQYGEHPITSRISQGTMSFYPLARSVSLAGGGRSTPDKTALVFTHRSSWGESDLAPITGAGGGKVEFDPARDRQGPLSLAVAVKAAADSGAHTQEKTRIVVFGDADFASNQYFGQQANGELLASSISWLAEGEDQLSIPHKEPPFNPIELIGNQGAVVLWVSVFILPFAVALSGLVVWFRRGYETYAEGLNRWLCFTFWANAVFYFVVSVIGKSEGNWSVGEGCLMLALACGVVGYIIGGGPFRSWTLDEFLMFGFWGAWGWGLTRSLRSEKEQELERQRELLRIRRSRPIRQRGWFPALVLALLNAVVGFWVIPRDTITLLYVQLLYAGLWVVNGVILLWIKKAFGSEREG